MRTFFIIIFILAILAGWYLFVRENYSDITNIDSGGVNIIAFGDSITNGYGVGRENAYPALLEKELGKKIINAGKNGDTTESALDRIEEDVLSKDPWIVIMYLGGNDILQKFSQEKTFDNLSQIIEKIQQKSAVVLLVGVRGPGVVTDPYKADFENLRDKYKTAYVPDILVDLLGRENLMYDTVHPSAEGHKIIAEKILKVLGPVIKEAEKRR